VSRDLDDFAAFYVAARDDCLRTLFAITRDRARAEDLVAEAFARAWASWKRVRTHPAPRAWVVRTALNANVSAWRRSRWEAPWIQEEIEAGATTDHLEGIDADLLAAVRRLPLRQREVLALRIFLDLDTAETSEVLGIARGTASAHLSRAIAQLRSELIPSRDRKIDHV
jgi:RNA polymerase sigma-70 factor (ECF subfamily)